MDREKDLLKQDLNKQETVEEINRFIEDTELMGGHEDIVELAKQRLQEISAKADTIEKTSESQVSQVENMGGSTEEIKNRTLEVDKKIEEVKTEAIKEVEAVKNETNTETAENSEITKIKQRIDDYQRSLSKNIEAQKQLVGVLDKKVESASLVSYLGTALAFSDETRQLRDLIRVRDSFQRDTKERDTAQQKILQFQNENSTNTEFSFGNKPEHAYVLVKGVNGIGVTSGTSLGNALNQIIENQNKEISDLEEKLK